MKILSWILIVVFFLVSCERESIIIGGNNQISKNDRKIKIAVFEGDGAGTVSVVETIEALRLDTGICASPISAAQIQNGELNNFDAIIIPGGSGSKQLNNIGKQGQVIIKDYVNNGGGIVGICAGAYMLSSTKGYPNMQIASSIHIDREHYNRGRGLVEFGLTEEGLKIFPELSSHKLFVQYYDGPVLAKDSLNKYNELAIYISDIHPDGFAPKGITPGRTFMLNQDYGKGKVFVMAGHPESTPGMRWIVPRMARWVSNNTMISYSDLWVKPELNTSEIIFDKEQKKYEKKLYWDIFSENDSIQLNAMFQLHKMRSRPAVRWNIGLLRSDNERVRLRSANILLETEYTAAIKDVERALKCETNEEVKSKLTEIIKRYNTL